MYGMQQPSLNLAHLASLPKQPWQSLLPVSQSTRSQPRTGTVTWRTPPVQPSQQPPSTTAKGVYQTAILQRGLWIDLAEVMQRRGRFLSQVWSPSKGLQLLQENLPAQLVLQLGQTVAWKVSPFLMGLRLNYSRELTEAVSSSTVSANVMAFINLSTNYYSKQKITADQYFSQHFQKNTRNHPARLLADQHLVKFFKKTVLIKIIEDQTDALIRNILMDLPVWGIDDGFGGSYSKFYDKGTNQDRLFLRFLQIDLVEWMVCLCCCLFLVSTYKKIKFKIKIGGIQIC